MNQTEAKRHRWVPWIAYPLVALVSIGVGASTNADPATSATDPAPRPTVTVPAPTKVIVRPECRAALRLSDQGFTLAGRAMGHTSDALTGAAALDADAIEKANKGLTDVNAEVADLAPQYRAARDECIR